MNGDNKQLHLAFDIENAHFTVTMSHGFFNLDGKRSPSSTVHSHSSYEVHTILEGSATIQTDGGSYQLSEGESIILPPELLHKSMFIDDACIRTSFYFSFREIKGRDGRAYRALADAFGGLNGARHVQGSSVIGPYFKRIIESYRSGSVLGDTNTRLLFSLILTELAEFCLSNKRSDIPRQQKSGDDTLLFAVIEEYLTQRFNHGASLAELAKLIHMSDRNTTRVFRRLFGTSFSEHIASRRAKTAKYLLGHTDMSLGDIASELGFATYSGFYSFFKEKTGVTPAKYREDKEKEEQQCET
ncbi:MAG: AraC family transcriptional regulator [Clostridia bacterium]|nr:AraC family transcriptional regulator [Clostridia bacterium]